MQVEVINQSGDTVETIELNDAVFNVPMNPSLVHQAMVIYQANRRQGTHDTKTRAEVSGGGRKPWIQKHTGRARQGSTRSPQWRHGGVAFGPHPRSYRKALPRRMRRHALRCVLSDKARNDRLMCLDSMDLIDGKTRSMAGLLERLNVSGSALIVTLDGNHDVVQAAGNLKKNLHSSGQSVERGGPSVSRYADTDRGGCPLGRGNLGGRTPRPQGAQVCLRSRDRGRSRRQLGYR